MSESAQGRSSVQRGLRWQRACAAYAREWFPHADHCGNIGKAGGSGDLTGVGDRIIECTVKPMAALAEKMREAESDAIRSEFDQFWVWMRARGFPVGQSYLITRAAVLWPLLVRLDRLEQWEAEQAGSAQDAWEAGYAAGYAARDGART